MAWIVSVIRLVTSPLVPTTINNIKPSFNPDSHAPLHLSLLFIYMHLKEVVHTQVEQNTFIKNRTHYCSCAAELYLHVVCMPSMHTCSLCRHMYITDLVTEAVPEQE